MSKKHLLILGGAVLAGWFLVDTLATLPVLSTVATTAHNAGAGQ